MSRRTPSEPATVGSAINRALEHFGLAEKVRQYTAVDIWPQIVGEKIAEKTVAEKIADGKLFVKVSSAAWRNELVFLKKELIAKLNKALGREVVNDIVFR